MTDVSKIRARHRAARVKRQWGSVRLDPLTGDHVWVAREVMLLYIGRTEYPPPPELFRSGELTVPAYPFGMPDTD